MTISSRNYSSNTSIKVGGRTLRINFGLGVFRTDSKKQSSSFIFLWVDNLSNTLFSDATRSCLNESIKDGFKEISIMYE